MELMVNLYGPVVTGCDRSNREKMVDIFVGLKKNASCSWRKYQPMQRFINVSYPLPACPSDRKPFGNMAPRLTLHICIFRCSLDSQNGERLIFRSNCESRKENNSFCILLNQLIKLIPFLESFNYYNYLYYNYYILTSYILVNSS